MRVMLNVKVVPGASRDQMAGRHGDGIKVRVAAPPEDGKANKAVMELVAAFLGVRPAQVQIAKGHTNPRKTLAIEGLSQAQLDRILADLP